MLKGFYKLGGWSKALLALFACHPKFLASAKLFAVPKVPKVPNFLKKSTDFMYNRQPGPSHPHLGMF